MTENKRLNLIPATDKNGKPWPTMAEVKAQLRAAWKANGRLEKGGK